MKISIISLIIGFALFIMAGLLQPLVDKSYSWACLLLTYMFVGSSAGSAITVAYIGRKNKKDKQ